MLKELYTSHKPNKKGRQKNKIYIMILYYQVRAIPMAYKVPGR